jgi:hypothetical protein
VEAVVQGRQYLSSGLSSHNRTEATGTQALRSLTQAGSPIAGTEKMGIPRSHEVEFYSNDAAFVVGFSRFIEATLEAGNAVIVIPTESHRKSLLRRLQEHGVDVATATAIEPGRYVPLDVADTLSTFMVNDLPDAARCLQVASDLVMEAAKTAQREPSCVAVCGESSPTLWAQGKADAAIQVEHLWDETARKHELDILCGYVLNSFQREQESDVYEESVRSTQQSILAEMLLRTLPAQNGRARWAMGLVLNTWLILSLFSVAAGRRAHSRFQPDA